MFRNLVPDYALPDIFAITPAMLRREGIRGVLVDLDGTMASRKTKDPSPRVKKWIAALQRSGYRCQCGREHESFVSAATGERYLEAHHLIPLRLQAQVWREQGVNLDCLENLVALCPTCHRAVHYGSRREKKQRLRALYEEKKRELRQAGVALTWAQLKQIYGLEE